MKRFLLLTLAVTLLIKDTLSLPTITESTPTDEVNEIEHGAVASISPASPTESESLSASERFIVSAFKRYANLLFSQLRSTHQIAKDVLADPTIAELGDEQMHGKFERLRKYVTQSDLEELKKIPPAELPNTYAIAIGTMFVLGNFDSVARELNSTSEQDRTPAEKLLWAALQRHGYQEHLGELEKRGIELFESYVDDLEKYVKSLSPADREKDELLVPGYDMYTKHPERFSKKEFGTKIFDVVFHEAEKVYK